MMFALRVRRSFPTLMLSLGLSCLSAAALGVAPASAQGHAERMANIGAEHHAQMMDYGRAAAENYAASSNEYYEASWASPAPRFAPSAMATVTHPDTSAVWGTAGHHSREAAIRRVMSACSAAMGRGCVLSVSGSGTGDAAIGVAVDGLGQPWIRGGEGSARRLQASALEFCREHAAVYGCSAALSFASVSIPAGASQDDDYSRDYFPTGVVQRRHWALLAFPDGVTASPKVRAWVLTGRQDGEAAKAELLQRCRAESGVACVIATTSVSNGVLVQFLNKRGQGSWLNAADARSAEARVRTACRADERPCRIQGIYDAATPRALMVEDPDLPRGYVSVAWPTSGNWNRLAIVTGRPTVAQANADALALCESRSQSSCELYLDHPDQKTSMFMGLYSLTEGRLHMVFGHTHEHVVERAAQFSQQGNTPYTNRVIVDLNERTELTPDY